MDKIKAIDTCSAIITSSKIESNTMIAFGNYRAECYNTKGHLKWSEDFDNLITTQGKNHLLNHGFNGVATAVNSRMSLITSGTPVIGDTYASHAGFVELSNTVVASRGTPSFGSASSASITTNSAVSFTAINTGTIIGIAINLIVGPVGNLGNVGDTSAAGILFSAGLFNSSKNVDPGDVLNISYTCNIT